MSRIDRSKHPGSRWLAAVPGDRSGFIHLRSWSIHRTGLGRSALRTRHLAFPAISLDRPTVWAMDPAKAMSRATCGSRPLAIVQRPPTNSHTQPTNLHPHQFAVYPGAMTDYHPAVSSAPRGSRRPQIEPPESKRRCATQRGGSTMNAWEADPQRTPATDPLGNRQVVDGCRCDRCRQ